MKIAKTYLWLAWAVALQAVSAAVFAQDVFSLPRCGKLSQPRQRHGAVIASDRIYIIGGQTAIEYIGTVQSATITADNKIGEWRDEAALPAPRAYLANSVQAVASAIYVIGGSTVKSTKASDPHAEVPLVRLHDTNFSVIGTDGLLSAWQKGPTLPVGELSCAGTCADDRHLIVTGGSGKDGIVDEVLVSTIQPGGRPAPWQRAGKLPATLWYHGCAIVGGRVYVWGGLHARGRDAVNSKIYSAPFAGGSLGEWREELEQMRSPVYSAGFCSGANALVSVGGKYANEYPTNCIWFTTVRNDALQPWRMLKTDLQASANLAVAVDKPTGRCFVTGGTAQVVPQSGSPLVDEVAAFQIPVN